MERSRTWQLMAMRGQRGELDGALRSAPASAPGRPRQTGQTLVFGSEPKLFAQPQKTLVAVRSWTWTSSPMTGSYLARISGERLNAVLILFSLEQKPGPHGECGNGTGDTFAGFPVWQCWFLG